MISITTSNAAGHWRDVDSPDVLEPGAQSQNFNMRMTPELTRRAEQPAALRE